MCGGRCCETIPEPPAMQRIYLWCQCQQTKTIAIVFSQIQCRVLIFYAGWHPAVAVAEKY